MDLPKCYVLQVAVKRFSTSLGNNVNDPLFSQVQDEVFGKSMGAATGCVVCHCLPLFATFCLASRCC